jgi:mRNA-degrading endonuclease RelE of RelBE toxin-antitoxin system
MKLIPSPRYRKSLRRLDPQIQQRVREKLKLFLQDKAHPSLRYKTVQALKHEDPPVKEISITMRVRISNSRFGVVSPIRTAHKPKRGDSVRVDGPREEKTGLRIGILTSVSLPKEVSGYSRSGN